MPKNVVARILKFNKTRNPAILKLKWNVMKESPFRFFRGACHLFYEDLPAKSFILRSPLTWICGDLHLENFGSFKGDNRVAYFDMNDFDEAVLAPCLLDVTRLCTSIFLISSVVKVGKADCRKLVLAFLKSYAATLTAGHISSIEPETATGYVLKFLETVRKRKNSELLERFSMQKKHADGLLLSYKSVKIFKAKHKDKKKVKKAIEGWARKNASDPAFFKVHDVAIRAAGTGSLGVERYIVLIEGKGEPEGNIFLDVKQEVPATPLKYLRLKQCSWPNEAERVISIQKRVQAESPAFLHPLRMGKRSFVMKELQPIEDKIDFTELEGDVEKLSHLLAKMGAIVAWNNLRCGGRQGSAIADKLIKFGSKMKELEGDILEYSEKYANRTVKYWKEFVAKFPGEAHGDTK